MMMQRRKFLQSLLGIGLAAGARPGLANPASANPSRTLVVMTSYPQEIVSKYTDAFQRAYPDTRIDIVWHSGDDARDYLTGAGKGLVDVYWAPSLRTFLQLKGQGVFRRLDIDRTGLPGRIGREAISDPEGFYEATEIAGYGFAVNSAKLREAGLPEPREWSDLADPAYAGQIVMPVPSRIGFAPTITEIILQAHGWKEGWALLARIAANSALQAGRGDGILAAVESGQKPIAITIDFFASQTIARGAKLRFVYPSANAFEPATVAIPNSAPNPEAGLDFVRFVLSAPGQRLLIDPDLRRLAVRPAVYAPSVDNGPPPGYFNPWTMPGVERLAFDNALFAKRRDIDNALFDAMIYQPREHLAPIWAKLRRADSKSLVFAEIESLLTTVPEGESEALELAPAFVGRRREGGTPDPAAREAEARWSEKISAAIDTATALSSAIP